MRNTFRSLTALTLALGVVLTTHAQDVTGAGASFPAPLYSKWAADYYKATGNKVNYQSVGSGAGIKQIDAKTVDFGASDMPLKDEELAQKNQLQFPTVIGGVVPVVNIAGVSAGQLKLTGEVIADIFLAKITKWNDPAIKALNPTLNLPDAAIAPVRRSDGSVVDLNDDWSVVEAGIIADRVFSRAGAFDLTRGSRDAVLDVRLPAGAYTATISAKAGAIGQALIEVYVID